jgi:PTS system nitrogen regulatory IIA component
LVARTRNSVINAMAKLAADTGLLWDPNKMADAVRRREDMQSTALDIGVALLHPRRPLPNILGEAFLVMGRTSQGIPFGGSSAMTDVFFLICSTGDRCHLRTLARLSRLLSTADFLTAVRDAEDEAMIRRRIVEFENAIG